MRSRTKLEEGFLFGGAGPWPGLTWPIGARMIRVVLIGDARAARGRQRMPGDLGQAPAGAGHDDQFLAVHPAPHPLTDMPGRGGIPYRPEPDRLIVINQAFLAKRDGVRLGRQPVQMFAFDPQPVRWDCVSLPMDAGVDLRAPLRACPLQLGERAVLAAQVRRGGHQIRLGDLHRGLGSALGFGIVGDTRFDLAAVVAAEFDHLRVPHRHPGDVLDGDGLGVVTQQIRRRPAEPPQRGVDAGHQRAEGLVPGRDHHPEPRPGQPRTKQLRTPATHPRSFAPVELQPHPRLGHPRPIHPAAARLPRRLDLGDRPPSRPLRPAIPHRGQPLVHLVGPDMGVTAVHPLLHLGQERIHRPPPDRTGERVPASVPHRHIPGDGLGVTAGQLRRRPRATGQSNASKISMISLSDLDTVPPDKGGAGTRHPKPTGRGGTTRIRTRRSPGDHMTAYLEFS